MDSDYPIKYAAVPNAEVPSHEVASPIVVGTVAPGYVQQHPSFVLSQQQPPLSLWATGLCDCFNDIDSLVESFCCTRCQLSRQYNMITKQKVTIEPWTFTGSIVADILIGCPLTGLLFAWYIRNRVRARYQIVDSDVMDCVNSFLFTPCSIAQIYREMSVRGEWTTGCCIDKPYQIVAPPPVVMAMESEMTPAQ